MRKNRFTIILGILLFLSIPVEGAWQVNKSLHISFLLDETGSMQERKTATISGFNEYIKSLEKKDEIVSFVLTKFNSDKISTSSRSINSNNKFPILDQENYCPNHMTPLYDAIAKIIFDTENRWIKDSNVLVVIFTDGKENYSSEYTRKEIFDLIKEKEEEGWTFVYLGCNQDAWEEGQSIGISGDNTFDWDDISVSDTFINLDIGTSNYIDDGCIQTDNFFKEDKK